MVAPLGSGALAISIWSFHRSAGDTTGGSVRNEEKLGGGEVVATLTVTSWLDIEPQVAARISFPDLGSAWLGGGGSGFRIRISSAISFVPTIRFDTGEIDDGAGHKVDLRGISGSAFLRIIP
jgi:hypothetical protein